VAERFDHAMHSGEVVDVEIAGRQIGCWPNPLLDAQGQALGRVTHWIDRTVEIQSEQEIADGGGVCGQRRLEQTS
jgi:hypothetical protein